jgi:hypothetical protein
VDRARAALTPAERLLVACAALAPDPAARAEVAAAVEAGPPWEALVAASRREGVSALLHRALAGVPGVPPPVTARLGALERDTWARNAWLTARWAEAVGALDGAGVASVTLKGMALIHAVYPDPGLRPMADVDLLIRPGDLPAARAALAGLGYRTSGPALEAAERFRGFQHFVRDITILDLHWDAANYTRFAGIVGVDHDGLWARRRPLEAAGARGAMPAPEDLLLHVALHLVLGSDFGRLVWYADLDAIVRRLPVDWDAALREAERWRARAALGRALAICRRWLGTPAPAEALRRAALPRVRGALADRCLGGLRPQSLGRPPADTARFLGEALLMDRARDALRVLARSLFPPRDWIRFHYPATSRAGVALYRALHPLRVGALALRHLR